MRDRNVFNWGELGEVVEPSVGRTSPGTSHEHSHWSHDGQYYSNHDYDRGRNGHLHSNAMPIREQNPFRSGELERVVDSSSRHVEYNHSSPGYGFLRQDYPYSGQGYDYSVGTTSWDRPIRSQPSAEAHDQILQNSAQSPEDDDPAGPSIPSETQQVWEHLPEMENVILRGKKPRHDVYRAFANTNERGVWASKVDKHIDFHVVINNNNKKRDGPKTITLQNNSPTHSVTYTLYDRKTKLFVWEKHLDPEEMEDVTLRSKTGLVNLYVKAGKPVKSR
ncbi:hypothetical protein PGTUg99_035731 [Puccinia graminis f. sp. tritici]|nr:hypothetical protein PGTUg99_035731 [Puccinia graminis f. sp. tritici]